MKKQKLNLKDLKIKSFVTGNDQIKGGLAIIGIADSDDTDCNDCVPFTEAKLCTETANNGLCVVR